MYKNYVKNDATVIYLMSIFILAYGQYAQVVHELVTDHEQVCRRP